MVEESQTPVMIGAFSLASRVVSLDGIDPIFGIFQVDVGHLGRKWRRSDRKRDSFPFPYPE
jgi:hypothetical protein